MSAGARIDRTTFLSSEHDMNRFIERHSVLSLGALAAASLMLAGCGATGPRNQGQPKSHRIESRLPGEGPYLGSADLVVATEQAVAGVASLPALRVAAGKTVIVMDRVETRTADPSANFQVYLARIRALLNQSGTRHNLAFVETRTKAEGIKEREGIPTQLSKRTRPRYALSGTFYDIPRRSTNYYLLTLQLVDLTDDVIAWEGSYEVKL